MRVEIPDELAARIRQYAGRGPVTVSPLDIICDLAALLPYDPFAALEGRDGWALDEALAVWTAGTDWVQASRRTHTVVAKTYRQTPEAAVRLAISFAALLKES